MMEMTMPQTLSRSALIGLALGMALTGCAAIEREDAEQTEQLLAAAGFEMRPADTPAKLADLQRLEQHKLVQRDRDGTVTYTYADAVDCKCLYSGDEKSYDAFQKLQVQQEIAEQEEMAASMNQEAEMNWEMWGPW
jgi:hypothetical protein